MNLLVINLFAEPAAGKSTGAAYIFSHLKMNGINAELIPEYAKELAWEKRLPPHPTDHWYITAQQAHRLWRVQDKVQVAIVDSPLLLGLVYGDHYDMSYRNYVRSLWDKYKNINYFVHRVKPFKKEGRHVNETTAIKINNLLKIILEQQKIQYRYITGDKTGYEYIVDGTLKALGVERKV